MAPFHEATDRGDLAEVKRLIAASPTLLEGRLKALMDFDSLADAGKDSMPLMIASLCGHAKIVECLLDQGADLEAVDEDDGTALTLLVSKARQLLLKYCCHEGLMPIIKMLIDGHH